MAVRTQLLVCLRKWIPLKTLAPAPVRILTTRIQIRPSVVFHRSLQMKNTPHLVMVAQRAMALMVMKRTAKLTVRTETLVNTMNLIKHKLWFNFMLNVAYIDDDANGASTSQLPESSSLTQHTDESSHQEACTSHAVDDELGKVTCHIGGMHTK